MQVVRSEPLSRPAGRLDVDISSNPGTPYDVSK